jgi:hypothetical protein
MNKIKVFQLISYLFLTIALSGAEKVFFGGVAFVGSLADKNTLYTHTYPLVKEKLGDEDNSTEQRYTAKIQELKDSFPGINLITQSKADAGKDALVMALAIDGENSTSYQLGSENTYKMTADLNAQILVFDYKSKLLVASRPIGLRLISAKNGSVPESADFKELYRTMLHDDTSPVSLLNAFCAELKELNVTRKESRRIQVRNVIVEEMAHKWLPNFYFTANENNGKLNSNLGQHFTKYLAHNTGANVLPYVASSAGSQKQARDLKNTGAALAQMAVRFDDVNVVNLVIPNPDYVVDVSLRGFSKSKGKESAGGESWIYGTYVNIKFLQPALDKIYLDQNLKNVYVSVLVKGSPVTKEQDWSAFNEATMVLFDRLTKNFLKKADKKWAKDHGSGKSTAKDLQKGYEILNKCK